VVKISFEEPAGSTLRGSRKEEGGEANSPWVASDPVILGAGEKGKERLANGTQKLRPPSDRDSEGDYPKGSD